MKKSKEDRKIIAAFKTLEEALFYFGCICLFMPLATNKFTHTNWFIIAIIIALLRKTISYKWQKEYPL